MSISQTDPAPHGSPPGSGGSATCRQGGRSASSPAAAPLRATAVLANFRQVVQHLAVRVHPVVAQLVDSAVLERM